MYWGPENTLRNRSIRIVEAKLNKLQEELKELEVVLEALKDKR